MKKPSVRQRLKYYQHKFAESQQNGRQVLAVLLAMLDVSEGHELAIPQRAIDEAEKGPTGFVLEPRLGHPDGGFVVRGTYDTPVETPGIPDAGEPACDPNLSTGGAATTPNPSFLNAEAPCPAVTPSDSPSSTGANDAA